MNPAFAIAEVVWIMTGRRDSAFLNFWNPGLPKYAGNGEHYHGAYGHRLRLHFSMDQLPLYVRTLEVQKRVLGEEHPDSLLTMYNLAKHYGDQRRTDDARPLVRALQEARRRRADRPRASPIEKNDLAWILLTSEPADLRDPETALRLARDACAMTDNAKPAYLDTLALAQHLTGDTPAAIETEKKALSLLPPDAPGRGEYEAALAQFETALKEENTAEMPSGG